MFFKRKEIYNQIEEYTLWKGQFCFTADNQQVILESMAKRLKIGDIRDLNEDNLTDYQTHLYKVTYSNVLLMNTFKTIRCFLRYFKSRGYDCMDPKMIGDTEIKKNQSLRRTMQVIHR